MNDVVAWHQSLEEMQFEAAAAAAESNANGHQLRDRTVIRVDQLLRRQDEYHASGG